jgi:hypothetical protein
MTFCPLCGLREATGTYRKRSDAGDERSGSHRAYSKDRQTKARRETAPHRRSHCTSFRLIQQPCEWLSSDTLLRPTRLPRNMNSAGNQGWTSALFVYFQKKKKKIHFSFSSDVKYETVLTHCSVLTKPIRKPELADLLSRCLNRVSGEPMEL